MNRFLEAEEITHRYIIGIDLGTTNSAMAYVDRTQEDADARRISFLRIPQLTGPAEFGFRPILPSFLYIPGPYELPPGSIALPWDPLRDYAVGEFAREQGALVPGRLVSSAKSWLCHAGVDRTAAILPWGAGSDVSRISPVEASSRYLRHMKEAWNAIMAEDRPEDTLEEQLVILTVPASFDEVARELTVTAARDAGFKRFVLLEEPLAAFYAWLSRHEDDWRDAMEPGQLILVCDVGGGTTDFTVVAVRKGETGLRFDRLAVGDHLMLGGDNMDLSLARHLEVQLFGKTGAIDSKRWHQLWHQCRKAKETLLGGEIVDEPPSALYDPEVMSTIPGLQGVLRSFGADANHEKSPKDSLDITVMGSGGKLIGDTKKGSLTRAQVEEIILEGFFPRVSLDEVPAETRRAGLTEWGLPYVQDPAVSRHLAAFWQRFRSLLQKETGRQEPHPEFILFNGGALTPGSIRSRILTLVQSWFQSVAGRNWSPVELENPRPELAVAIGAAYYGMVRMGEGVRVGAGSPRAYYVEVGGESEVTLEEGEQVAVCVVPRGSEEGFQGELSRPAFQVLTNQPVVFKLFSSSTKLGDALGDVVCLPESEVTTLPPIRTVLRYGKKGTARTLPVQLATRLTEVGTLELWCHSLHSPHRWQLQFDVRQEGEPQEEVPGHPEETLDANVIEQAREIVAAVFQSKDPVQKIPPEKLMKRLTAAFEMGKEKWPLLAIRKLADTLIDSRQGASLSPQHEARWLNLLGFCLRPGFGDPIDSWRMKELWKIFPAGLVFPRQPQGRMEWWILWRRTAGGLTAGQQMHLFQQMSPLLLGSERKKKRPAKQLTRAMSTQEEVEIWMTLASMERLPAKNKVELGQTLLGKIQKGKPKPQDLWALSRLGARIPFHGPLDQVIPGNVAWAWIQVLLSLNTEPSEAMANTLVQLGRVTGDRERDLKTDQRDSLIHWLETLPKGSRFVQVITNPDTTLLYQEREWIFGETLPAGLVLSDPPQREGE